MIQGAKEYSEATAELIDSEVRNIIQKQYEKAVEILKEKRQVLEKGTALLLDKEKIDGNELKAIMVSSETTEVPA